MRNTFGNIFTLTTFGESHGDAVGGVIDGMPAGIDIDIAYIQKELDRRRPGQSHITTGRKEADQVEILSGVFEGKSTGCPIGFIVHNTNQHSHDYDNLKGVFRPSPPLAADAPPASCPLNPGPCRRVRRRFDFFGLAFAAEIAYHIRRFPVRRDGRVAEGSGLLNRHTD